MNQINKNQIALINNNNYIMFLKEEENLNK